MPRPSTTPLSRRASSSGRAGGGGAKLGRSSSARKGGAAKKGMEKDPVGYWDSLADTYADEVFSSIDQDRHKVIERSIAHYGDSGVACDFGCGCGFYLPTLARHFGSVVAMDLSSKLVAQAQQVAGGLEGGLNRVRVLQHDLSSPPAGVPLPTENAAFGVCANVLISPSERARTGILCSAHGMLRPGAHLLVVTPSTEAALYIAMRLAEVEAPKKGGRGARKAEDAMHGVFPRGGTRTKHFLKEEMMVVAPRCGFKVLACEKVEYPWDVETDDGKEHRLREPLPWDWLFILRRG